MAVAIGAQAALYLTLRRIAVATLPAWAHGHVFHSAAPAAPSPVVGVNLVAGPAPSPPRDDMPVLPAPEMQPVPLVPVQPPALPGMPPANDTGR